MTLRFRGFPAGCQFAGNAPISERADHARGRREERTRGGMNVEPAIRDQMLAALPSLRSFALSLCGNVDKADDFVQDIIMRAWAAIDRFERGTNLNA